jgi:uncharacterized protein YqgC (DUF456 family)
MNYKTVVRWVTLAISLSLLITAYAIPCLRFVVDNGRGIEFTGIELTVGGSLGLIFLLLPSIGCFATPLWVASCFFFLNKQYRRSLRLSVAAIIVGFLGTSLAFWIPLPTGSGPDEMVLSHFLHGFWIWLAAPALIASASKFFLIQPNQ